MKYKLYQHQKMHYSMLCILILICSNMVRRDCHIQGAYINVVKTYGITAVLQ